MQANKIQRQVEWNVDMATLQWIGYFYIYRSLWPTCSFYQQPISTVLLRRLGHLKLVLVTNAEH